MKRIAKRAIQAFSLAVVFFPALLTGFGRSYAGFTFFAQAVALLPGLPGDFIRVAYYHLTLAHCSLDSRISFGSIVSHPRTRIASGIYIGAYTIIGCADIETGCQIASHVQILAGKQQHSRDRSGKLLAANVSEFPVTRIGAQSWLGASAIIMADLGEGVTVGAGSVVTKPVESWSTAVGSPARIIAKQA